MSVRENISAILREIGNVKLVCVTKTVEVERINESLRAGALIIGENRIQEFESKYCGILPCEKHFIGHLQTNKVRDAVKYFDVIESVDSYKLACEIDRKAGDINKVQNVFLQINIGNEPQKYGFSPYEIENEVEQMRSLVNVCVKGLMCIPPYLPPEQTRHYFTEMKNMFDALRLNNRGNIEIRDLSMGMSGDYMVAIEEGATMVRIGSAIFGSRKC